jgi:hypothetical protein
MAAVHGPPAEVFEKVGRASYLKASKRADQGHVQRIDRIVASVRGIPAATSETCQTHPYQLQSDTRLIHTPVEKSRADAEDLCN